ncbi:MAG: GAF domain-containing protein [Oscillochloris sp.]|nr:GAF domain-containing protein [Oscillochloris sp.]
MTRTVARRHKLILELERQRDLLRLRQAQDQRVLSALYAISLVARDRPSWRSMFETIYQQLATVFSFDACYIAFCDERPDFFKAGLLVDEGQMTFIENMEYGFLTGNIVHSGEPLLYRDLLHERDPDAPRVPFGQIEKRSRAWLGVPLLIGADRVGVISIQSYQVGIYTTATRDLLQRMANVIAVALENVVLIERRDKLSEALAAQVARRNDEIAALSAIAGSLVERQPLAELLDSALLVAQELFGFDAGNVRLLDESREALLLHAQRGFPEQYTARTVRSPLNISPIRDVVLSGKPMVISDGWRPPPGPPGLFPAFSSALILPIISGDVTSGTLSLFGFAPRSFDEHMISLAQAVANQIAVVIENARLFEERERQIAELRALSTVSRAASTAHTLNQLLHEVHAALKTFLPLDTFSMLIYDPERGVVSDALSIDEGQAYAYWRNQPPPAHSLSAYLLRERRSLRFNNLPEEIGAIPALDPQTIGAARTALSWMGMPLIDRDERVIGLLTVQSYRENVFGPRDELFLSNVAAQVALHAQNVRLLIQRERQIRELEAIGAIGKIASASYNLDLMLSEVCRVLVELSDASVFYLLVCEPGTRMITHAVFVEQGEPIPLDLLGKPVRAATLSDWVLTHREPLLFVDLVEQRHELTRRGIEPQAVGPENPVRSWAGVPLVARDGELIGVLSLQDYRAYTYDAATLDLLDQVASHVSLGVQKVRLLEERERQAAENARLAADARAHANAAERQAHRIELVHRISTLLSARLDQQEILELASRELVQLFWADHTGTVLFDSDEYGTVVAEYPQSDTIGETVMLRDNLLVAELQRARRPVVIADVASDPLAITSRDGLLTMGIQSLVVVPLISRDQVFGSISLDSYHGRLIFSDEELELMMTVATSIAAAVENAQLFAAEQRQRQTAETLREMARVLSTSFDPDTVLRLVLTELQRLIAYDTASIMLLEGEQLRIVAVQGWDAEEAPRGLLLPVEGSAAGEVVHRREPVLRTRSRTDGAWAREDVGQHIHGWIGVPLIARSHVRGVLNIDARRPGAFTERDIEVARSFANHAALAIENARLYQESVARVEQEMEIARRIQSNLFPRQLPAIPRLQLAAVCLPARETGGDFYDLIDLGARVGVVVGDVSGKSLPAAMLMAVARSTARSEVRNHETPWVVLVETNRWLVDDVPRHSFVALSYALVDPVLGQVTLANGGQLTPLMRRADGTLQYLEQPNPALPLGMSAEFTYGQLELPLAPGDTLIFYTDGIVEAHDQFGHLFGFERLEKLLCMWGHLEPPALIDRVLAEVHAFAEGMPAHDDMTIVVVRVTAN